MPKLKLFKPLIAALLLNALPFHFGHNAEGKVILTFKPAMAKSGSGSEGDGGSDDGGDDGGEDGRDDDDGDGDNDNDDDGDNDNDDDGDNDDDDDEDDDDDDDNEHRDRSGKRSGNKSATSSPEPGRSLAISRVEVSNSGIEVRYVDGTREEIEHGVYEVKDRTGKTLLERRATGPDISRLRALAEGVSIRNVTRDKPSRTGVAHIRSNRKDIVVEYANGWLEVIKRGRYQLKDPFGRTVVLRPATATDRLRLSNLTDRN